MIEIVFAPPPAIKGKEDNFRFKGGARSDKKVKANGTVVQSYLFERKAGELRSIFDALVKVPCNANIKTTVTGNVWTAGGTITIWRQKDRLLIEEVINDAEVLLEHLAGNDQNSSLSINFTQVQNVVV